jgi:WD40 repeat protein
MEALGVLGTIIAAALAAVIARYKGRGAWRWAVATLVLPLPLLGISGSAFAGGLIFMVCVVLVLPAVVRVRQAARRGRQGAAVARAADARAAKRLARLRKNLLTSSPGKPAHQTALQELVSLNSAGAAGVLLEYARERPDEPDGEGSVWSALALLTDQGAVDQICRAWDQEPLPALERVLASGRMTCAEPPVLRMAAGLLTEQMPGVQPWPEDKVRLLADLLGHKSAEVRRLVRAVLGSLSEASDLDDLCMVARDRPEDAELRELVKARRVVATAPPDLRVWSAVVTGQGPQVVGEDPEAVLGLVSLWQASKESEIGQAAWAALQGLAAPGQTDVLCDLAIDRVPDDGVRDACRDLRLVPSRPGRRALFYVLAQQFDLLDGLDPDGSLLRAAYEELDEAPARRVREALLAAGRATLLTQVLAHEAASRDRQYRPAEAAFVVDELAGRRDWRRLWAILPGLPFAAAVRAVRAFDVEEARAQLDGAVGDLERLRLLAQRRILDEAEVMNGALPALVRVATLSVRARVNDLVFSPADATIAIALGSGRSVALWNYRSGAQATFIRGFKRAVGRVAFAADGTVFCAEKTSSTFNQCSLYRCAGSELVELGQHRGSVTALLLVDDARVVSAGRDQELLVWPATPEGALTPAVRMTLPSWPRQSCAVVQGGRLVGVAMDVEDLLIVDPTTQTTLATLPLRTTGRATAMITAPPAADDPSAAASGSLLMGTTRGALYQVDFRSEARPPAGAPGPPVTAPDAATLSCRLQERLGSRDASLVGLEWLDDVTLCAAWSDGLVRVLAWPALTQEWELQARVEKITSTAASADGDLLAVGDGSQRSLLFDTRGRRLRDLFRRAPNGCSPRDWSCVRSLLAGDGLSAEAADTLAVMDQLLENRFRHDVGLVDETAVAHGEFDIAIEE